MQLENIYKREAYVLLLTFLMPEESNTPTTSSSRSYKFAFSGSGGCSESPCSLWSRRQWPGSQHLPQQSSGASMYTIFLGIHARNPLPFGLQEQKYHWSEIRRNGSINNIVIWVLKEIPVPISATCSFSPFTSTWLGWMFSIIDDAGVYYWVQCMLCEKGEWKCVWENYEEGKENMRGNGEMKNLAHVVHVQIQTNEIFSLYSLMPSYKHIVMSRCSFYACVIILLVFLIFIVIW